MNELDIFSAALDLSDLSARAHYLDQTCGGSGELRDRIEALLKNAAHALSKRGLWYYDTGRPHESLDDFRLAFQVQKPIVAASSERPWPRFILALAYHNYALVLTAERHFDQAEQYYRLALEQKEILLQDQPANPTFRWHYAMGYQCLAESLAGAEKWDDALVACRQSNELHQALTGDCPKIPLFRMSYVQNLLTSARVMEHFDDWLAVNQHYRQAVEQAETMVGLSDQDVRFCGTWAHACRKCCDFFMGTDQADGSAATA